MRLVSLLALAGFLLAGCLAGPQAGPNGDGDAPPSAGPDRVVKPLGTASGASSLAGRYPLEVQVPAGGATRVAWTLRIENAEARDEHLLEGLGCVREESTTYVDAFYTLVKGSCADQEAGAHEAVLVLTVPVVSYSLEVAGSVLPVSQ